MALNSNSHCFYFALSILAFISIFPTAQPSQAPTPYPFLIFQLGHHKCGTRWLYFLFKKNNIKSVHNNRFHNEISHNTTMVRIMNEQWNNNYSQILSDLDNKYRFYSDYGTHSDIHHIEWYKILSNQYPNSKYILLIRNINRWLKSRYLHYSYPVKQFIVDRIKSTQKFQVNNKNKNMSDIEQDIMILKEWKEDWYNYICQLLIYFKLNNIQNDLLIYNTEYDNVYKIINYFEKYDLPLIANKGHQGSTKKENKGIAELAIPQLNKWQQIIMKYPEFNHSVQEDEFDNEYWRVRQYCEI